MDDNSQRAFRVRITMNALQMKKENEQDALIQYILQPTFVNRQCINMPINMASSPLGKTHQSKRHWRRKKRKRKEEIQRLSEKK